MSISPRIGNTALKLILNLSCVEKTLIMCAVYNHVAFGAQKVHIIAARATAALSNSIITVVSLDDVSPATRRGVVMTQTRTPKTSGKLFLFRAGDVLLICVSLMEF